MHSAYVSQHGGYNKPSDMTRFLSYRHECIFSSKRQKYYLKVKHARAGSKTQGCIQMKNIAYTPDLFQNHMLNFTKNNK